MKNNAVIFDIDGTLTDSRHRKHFIEKTEGKKDWNSFYENSIHDLPNRYVANMVGIYEILSHKIIYVSGRPERYRKITIDWMNSNLKMYGKANKEDLFMRPDGDFSKDDDLKKKIYLEKIEPYYEVKLIFDDRDRVVKMWRSLGLECWQVAEGNF